MLEVRFGLCILGCLLDCTGCQLYIYSVCNDVCSEPLSRFVCKDINSDAFGDVHDIFDDDDALRLATLVATRYAVFSDDLAICGHRYAFKSKVIMRIGNRKMLPIKITMTEMMMEVMMVLGPSSRSPSRVAKSEIWPRFFPSWKGVQTCSQGFSNVKDRK